MTAAVLSTNISASDSLRDRRRRCRIGAADAAIRGQDAPIIAFNLAGMTRLDDNQFTFCASALYGDVDHRLDGTGALQGNSPGTVVGWFPGLSTFYSPSYRF